MPYNDPEKRRENYKAWAAKNPDYQKQSYAKHRAKRLAAKKAAREADVEAAKAYQRDMYAKHQAARVQDARDYRQNNQAEVNTKARERYYANRETLNERRKAYREKNKDVDYQKIQQWRRENPDAVRKYAVKTLIHDATGLPRSLIPDEIVETKMMQLEIERILKERAETP